MLIAIDEQGNYTHLINDMDSSLIESWRTTKEFFCPQCREKLIIKAGKIKITHFSHYRHSDCQTSFSEPESARHLQGKKDLYLFFKQNSSKVELEPYLRQINQRPDLLVQMNEKRYAIEFQCSVISPEMIQQRTEGYKKIGIIPIWIFGGTLPPQRLLTLSTFQLSMTRFYSSNLILLCYDPDKQNLQFLTQITKITESKYDTKSLVLPLQNVRVPIFLDLPAYSFSNNQWLNLKHKWITQRIRYGNLIDDPFLKTVYEQGEHPSAIPIICGIPVKFMETIKEHPIEWQYYIYCDSFKRLKVGDKISLKFIYYKFRQAIKQKKITIQTIEQTVNHLWEQAIKEYFHVLTKLNYVLPLTDDLYMMKQEFIAEQSVELQSNNEKLLFQQSDPFLKREQQMIHFFQED